MGVVTWNTWKHSYLHNEHTSKTPSKVCVDKAIVFPTVFYGCGASLVAQTVKNLSAMWETWVRSGMGRSPGGGHGNPLQNSCLENPNGEERGVLQSMGLQRVDRTERLCTHTDGCERWTIKAERGRIDAFELWCWRRSWESLGLQGDQTSRFLTTLTLNIHWKDYSWSWSSNTLATWCKTANSLETTLMLPAGSAGKAALRETWVPSVGS